MEVGKIWVVGGLDRKSWVECCGLRVVAGLVKYPGRQVAKVVEDRGLEICKSVRSKVL